MFLVSMELRIFPTLRRFKGNTTQEVGPAHVVSRCEGEISLALLHCPQKRENLTEKLYLLKLANVSNFSRFRQTWRPSTSETENRDNHKFFYSHNTNLKCIIKLIVTQNFSDNKAELDRIKIGAKTGAIGAFLEEILEKRQELQSRVKNQQKERAAANREFEVQLLQRPLISTTYSHSAKARISPPDLGP